MKVLKEKMKILKEIFRNNDLKTKGETIHREAVRGIALRQRNILMIYSPVNGDYKFPGGGVDAGESYEDALAREIREECGAQLFRVERELGCIIEYDHAKETDYDLFKMASCYYLCAIVTSFGPRWAVLSL